MQSINIQYFDTCHGELLLGSYSGRLCLCDWRHRNNREQIDARIQRGLQAKFRDHDDPLLQATRRQLAEYFNRARREFDIPLRMVGTAFQQQVWRQLRKIPFGQTSSYRELAAAVGNEKAVRAVASANGANAISILIPCHRVIGCGGQLTGYAGGLKTKAELLALEFELFNPR